MKTEIDLYFKTSDGKRLGPIRKRIDVNFVPILNAFYEDSAWSKPKEIIKIFINPEEGYYMLEFSDEVIENESHFNDIVKGYGYHGWSKL
jgi:hypothetical protein